MAAGLPDLVDCTRLAEEAAVIERVYALSELPRLQDVLAERDGTLRASFVFSKLRSGHAGARVSISAEPRLVCQRCMLGFASTVTGGSDVEFARGDAADTLETDRELYQPHDGSVSLRDLAEEELLLALPIAAACDTPQTCGNAPSYAVDGGTGAADEMRRPFAALQDLLKKT